MNRIPIADIFLSKRKRRAAELQVASSPKPDLSSLKPVQSSSKPALNFITPKMVKIGASLNVVPPSDAATTTTTLVSSVLSTTSSTLEAEEVPFPGMETSLLSAKIVSVESTTSSTTERRPKVVAVDDDKLFPDTDHDQDQDPSGAKPFSSFDYGDRKLG